MRLPVIVATPESNCVATRALDAERARYRVALTDTPTAYGELLVRQWQQGGFVLVEWDIAPWPGALQQLQECDGDLCVFQYHFWQSAEHWGYGYSLGCTKFSERFTKLCPLHPTMATTHWQDLDTSFWNWLGPVRPCIHHPGVAHARYP